MKIACISDIHEQWTKIQIPECDILISAGDYSYHGDKNVIEDFHEWLDKQPAKNIISVQGNHEVWVEKNFKEAKAIAQKVCPRVHFIEHELIEIEGIKIFGSAWTPFFCNWAYNGARTESEAILRNKPRLKDLWNDIPNDTDILITHSPAYKILDEVPNGWEKNVGCYDLYEKILTLPKLKHHICGHIHWSHGHKRLLDVNYWNVAICNESYQPVNPVTIIEL